MNANNKRNGVKQRKGKILVPVMLTDASTLDVLVMIDEAIGAIVVAATKIKAFILLKWRTQPSSSLNIVYKTIWQKLLGKTVATIVLVGELLFESIFKCVMICPVS